MLERVLQDVKDAYSQSGSTAGGKFATAVVDVSKREEVHSLLDKVPEELRNVDILGEIANLYIYFVTNNVASK